MNQSKAEKKLWIQPPITEFLVRKSEITGNKEENTNKSYLNSISPIMDLYKENTSPEGYTTKELVYHTPIVDMTNVLKDKDFYSMTPFKEEGLMTVKKALFDSDQETDHNNVILTDVEDQLIQDRMYDLNAIEKNNKLDIYDFNTELSEGSQEVSKLIPFASHVNRISSVESKKPQKKPLSKPDDSKQTVDSIHTDTGDTRRIVNKSKRAPNEIKAASLKFPVLIREPPLKDLRQELDSMGICKPFSVKFNGFQELLEGIGLDEVKNFVLTLELDEKSTNLKTCFYCRFVTESSLVMGRHLDVSHKNRFKQWPLSKRMDSLL